MSYFSEREQGERPRNSEVIAEGAWGGIQALLRSRVEDGSFGATYAETCNDGAGPVGTDTSALAKAVRAEIPAFAEPPWFDRSPGVPGTLDILDLVEFSWRTIGKPLKGGYHSFFNHHHLSFDVAAGRDESLHEFDVVDVLQGVNVLSERMQQLVNADRPEAFVADR